MAAVILNSFVTRQNSGSPFSHYDGSWSKVVALAATNFDNARPGYRDGVLLVDVDPTGFFSGVVTLTEGAELTGSFKARREGEAPRKQVLAKGCEKLPAKSCFIVLYRSDVLAEDGDSEALDHLDPVDTWEVISINASPTEGEMPIDPVVLMHNHFGSDGGTDTNLSDADFVAMLREAFDWWKDKAMCG